MSTAAIYELEGALREAFRGHGRALRKRDDPPLPGEPWMSMADAIEQGARAAHELQERNMKSFERTALTIAVIGFLAAVVAGILYLMELPVFDAEDMAWAFVFGLVAAAIAAGALFIKTIWTES